jgi:SAM-dependent methyltransferase
MTTMSTWSGGYVADVEYVSGFYRQQSPPHLTLAALLVGVDGRLPAPTEGPHYLELGCGKGMNALLLAASNPGWRVTAVDYNPAHIAIATEQAREAGLTNVNFIEASFGELAERPPPLADVVSMHGVWSWVAPGVRADIVRLLGRAVAPGGLVHLSYNALPAWQGAIGLQRLVYEAGRRGGGRSDRQVVAGLAFAREAREAGARYLSRDSLATELLDHLATAAVGYLAHEYMNAHWSPCFHADVAAALAEAKLDWTASASLLESFPDLMLSEPQRALLDRFDDPLMRELVKDVCLPRQLRHDLFVRGARRMRDADRDAALGDLVLSLSVPADEFVYTMDVPAGSAALGPAFHDYVNALRSGPHTVRSLLALAPGHSNPAELAAVMVGTNQAHVVARPGAAQADGANRLNRLLGRRIVSVAGPEPSGGLASAALATGLPATRVMQFVCARMLEGEDDAGRWFAELSHDVPPEQHDVLRRMLADAVDLRVPVMRQVGILP